VKLSLYLIPRLITNLEAVDKCLNLEKIKLKIDFWGQRTLCVKTYEGSIPFKTIMDQMQRTAENTKTLFREDKEAAKRIVQKLKKICERYDGLLKRSNWLVQCIRYIQDPSFAYSKNILNSPALLASFE
jgi:hypothetical protein